MTTQSPGTEAVPAAMVAPMPPVAMPRDETGRLALFVSGDSDVEGMIAYALHSRALAAFRSRFAKEAGRAISHTDEAAFLIGETDPARIASYRAEAARLILQGAADEYRAQKPSSQKPSPQKPSAWPRLGLLPDAALAGAAPGIINWRGLIGRLAVLLLAVITTALLLRILVVGG